MRIVRGDGWLRGEVVLLKSRRPKCGTGSMLMRQVKQLLNEERREGETVTMVAMALPSARSFFEKQGFGSEPDAEQLLHEIYDPFGDSENIWNVDWDPSITSKLVWHAGASSGVKAIASLDVPHVEVDHVVIVHVRTGLVSGDVVVGGSHRTRECEDECRGDVRCAHGVVVEGVEGAEDL